MEITYRVVFCVESMFEVERCQILDIQYEGQSSEKRNLDFWREVFGALLAGFWKDFGRRFDRFLGYVCNTVGTSWGCFQPFVRAFVGEQNRKPTHTIL